MGSSGLDGSPLLIYGFHVTEHLRAVADQKRVLYWSRWKYYWNQIKSVHNDFEVTLDYRSMKLSIQLLDSEVKSSPMLCGGKSRENL